MSAETTPVIYVDQNGVDQNGEDYSYSVAPEAVAAGYVTSRSVLLVYPDGLRVEAQQTLVTPNGLEELKRRMGKGVAGSGTLQ